MMVLNTIAKFYPQYDRPSKSRSQLRGSSNSRPRSHASQQSGSKHSEAASDNKSEIPRQILNNEIIQQFIYQYINEKMKCDKMQLQVDGKFEAFLASLANPLQLNEMRTMKEPNYSTFRKLISNFTGSPLLRLMKEN